MQRTVRLELNPTPEQFALLCETLRQHTECFNVVATHGWKEQVKNGIELHKATYYALRERFPKLPSQLVCASRVKATEVIASAMALAKKGKKVNGPQSKSCPIRYDARSHRVMPCGTLVSLATVEGRQNVAFGLYDHARDLMEKAASFDSADLLCREGRWFLHLVVTLPEVEVASSGEVVGVDFKHISTDTLFETSFQPSLCTHRLYPNLLHQQRVLHPKYCPIS